MKRRTLLAILIVGTCVFTGGTVLALPVIPTPLVGDVSLGSPDSNKEVLATVNFRFTFDPTLVTETEQQSLGFNIDIVFGPDVLEPGEGFRISEVETGSAVIFGFDNLNANEISFSIVMPVSPGDIIFGLPDGIFPYILTPLTVWDSSTGTAIAGPAVDVLSFSVSIFTLPDSDADGIPDRSDFCPTDPQNTCQRFLDTLSVPEPGALAIFGLGLLGLGALRRRRRLV